jgi:hypothetical protein
VEIKSSTTAATTKKKPAAVKPALKKSQIKALKKANPAATKSLTSKPGSDSAGRRGRPSGYKPEAKITVLAKENPKREGSASYKEFELYRKHKTVGAFLAAGGTSASLRWDSEHKFIKIG